MKIMIMRKIKIKGLNQEKIIKIELNFFYQVSRQVAVTKSN